MPNVLAPKPVEWTYRDVVGAVNSKNSTPQLNKPPSGIAVDIRMQQQIYVPGRSSNIHRDTHTMTLPNGRLDNLENVESLS
jgi:hypothetical protein